RGLERAESIAIVGGPLLEPLVSKRFFRERCPGRPGSRAFRQGVGSFAVHVSYAFWHGSLDALMHAAQASSAGQGGCARSRLQRGSSKGSSPQIDANCSQPSNTGEASSLGSWV